MAVSLPQPFKWFFEALYLEKYLVRWADRWTIIRVWVGLWLCSLMMIIRPIEEKAGQAAFLTIIFGFIKPPAEPAIIWIYQMFLGGIVVLTAWGWCTLGMKFALLARDHDKDLRLMSTLQSSYLKANPTITPAQIEGRLNEDIFRGHFLQTGPSAIFAVFLVIGVYFCLMIRAQKQRLFFMMILSVIVVSIFCTYGPLIPQFYAIELGQIYFIPFGMYLACTTFASLFIMPQSVSNAVMEKLRLQGVQLTNALKLTPAQLLSLNDGDVPAAVAAWEQNRMSIITQWDLTLIFAPFLAKEISVQKSSGKDIDRLLKLMRLMSFALSGQSVFIKHVRSRRMTGASTPAPADKEKTLSEASSDVPVNQNVAPFPYAAPTALRDLLSDLAVTTTEQQDALVKGLEALTNFIDRETGMSHFIFGLFKQPPMVVEELQTAFKTLQQTKRDPNEKDDEESTEPSFLREIWFTFLQVFTAELEQALDLAIKIEQRRVRIWWPGSQNVHEHPQTEDIFSLLHQLRNAGGGQAELPLDEDDPDRISGVPTPGDDGDLERDAPQRSVALTVFQKIYDWFIWFTHSKESIFCLKVSLVAFVLALPAWIEANGTAEFYYKEKGIWALVTGVTAKGMFSGETTYGFIQRGLGVFVGGLVALVVWYAGTGSGTGNPYGLATTIGVALVLMVPWRIWNPNFLMVITAATSSVLIVGYSWADRPENPVPTLWGPGQGWEVWWRRELLVLVGITAAWLIDLFPRPQSGKDTLRRTYSRVIGELGVLSADILKSLRHPPADPVQMFMQNGDVLRALALKLRVTNTRLLLAKLEPSLKKQWNTAKYVELQKLQWEMIDLLAMLAFACERSDAATRAKLLSSQVLQPPKVAAALNLIYTASSALATEKPLPAILPSPHRPDAADLDTELARIAAEDAGNDPQQKYNPGLNIIAQGCAIQLAVVAEQMVAATQVLFGTTMMWQ